MMAHQQKKRDDNIATNSNSENTNNSFSSSLYQQLSSSYDYDSASASVNEPNNALVPVVNREASEAEIEAYLSSFPPGYRFKPSDEELVREYLQNKILNKSLPPNNIKEVELYKHSPDTLAAKYKPNGNGEEWYFFTPRDRKYPNGERPNRAAGDGYWKATGADKAIPYKSKTPLGQKKSLVFYKGKPKSNSGSSSGGKKTNWIMQEYRLEDPNTKRKRNGNHDMKLDDWVLCKIYNKLRGRVKANEDEKESMKDDDNDYEETKREEEEEEEAEDYSRIMALDSPIPMLNFNNHEIDPYLNISNSSLLPIQQYNGVEENFGTGNEFGYPFQYHYTYPNEFNTLENLDVLAEFQNTFDKYDPPTYNQPKPEA